MVQTSIGNKLAFGKPGEHGNGQPWFADAGIVGETAVKFGEPVKYASGLVAPLGSSDTTFVGIAVSPNQHVRQVLPTDSASLMAAPGDTIAVAKKGSWFIEVDGLAAAPTITKFVSGVKITAGKWAIADSDTVADILDYEVVSYTVGSDTKYRAGLLIRIK